MNADGRHGVGCAHSAPLRTTGRALAVIDSCRQHDWAYSGNQCAVAHSARWIASVRVTLSA